MELQNKLKGSIWISTLNNPKVDPKDFLELWFTKGKAKYVCGQLEKG